MSKEPMFPPGAIVRVPFWGVFRHVGLVTERGTVISSKRGVGVVEEPVEDFAIGRKVRVERLRGTRPIAEAIAWARARVGQPWSLANNCEHFVREALGLPAASPQLRATAAVAATALTLVVASRGRSA